jgi:hypothetical protein
LVFRVRDLDSEFLLPSELFLCEKRAVCAKSRAGQENSEVLDLPRGCDLSGDGPVWVSVARGSRVGRSICVAASGWGDGLLYDCCVLFAIAYDTDFDHL